VLFGFETDPFEYLDEAVTDLETELGSEDAVVGVRPGYDDAPKRYDLWTVAGLAFNGEEGDNDGAPWQFQELEEFLEESFDSGTYLDWTVGSGFREYRSVEQEGFEYSGEGSLTVRVYEEGWNGHAILRL